MNTKELLGLYERMSNKHQLPSMSLWQLTWTSQHYGTAEDAMAAIAKFAPVAGWLGFQSTTQLFRDTEPRPVFACTKDTGVLLNAEVVNTAGESLHVRYDSAGSWIITHYAYTTNGECLADNVKLVIHGKPGGFMYYKRFWRIDAEHGPIPFIACLTGIDGANSEVT